ncbi:MAG: hypothetical protein ACLP7O_05490 [Terracidiphilus sp.]
MKPLRVLPIFLAVASIAAVRAPVQPQTARVISADQPQGKEIHPVERPMPFSSGAGGNANSIEFRTVGQMTQKDRDLVADAESSISERAGHWDLEFNGGKWSYQQVVCPALPNHIFLRFTRNNGTGDVSVFSASIPRGGDGRVRIIPILLRGYSLFSPAPINALTISAFNHIRAEEHPDKAPEWLGTGLCYATLAGGHPQAVRLAEDPQNQKFPVALPALMKIPNRGGAILSFADVSAAPRPMEWTMTFDGKGRLLKATHKPAALIPVKALQPAPGAVNSNAAPPAPATADPAPAN